LVISNAGEIGELSQAKEAGAVDWILKQSSAQKKFLKSKNIFQTKNYLNFKTCLLQLLPKALF